MFCSGCGQPLDPSQLACQRCGRPVPHAATVGAAIPAAYLYTRVHRNIQPLSILWIAYGIWTLLTWVLAMSVFSGFVGHYFGHWGHGPFGEFPFHTVPWFAQLITVILFGRAILCIATGMALARRAPWARILALVAAFLTLIKPITGTALAIYTLWALIPAASGQEYEQMSSYSPGR
jgi:hypothetical protein